MKKFDKGYIFYHLIIDFFAIFFFLFIATVSYIDDWENTDVLENFSAYLIYLVLVFLGLYLIKTVYSILYYNTSYYELKDSEIECRRGVLFRKKSILEYGKINAVNKKQNLIHKIFKIAVLTLDSGSTNTSSTAEILIIEKESVIDDILEEIKAKSLNKEYKKTETAVKLEKQNLYSFTTKNKFLYTIVNAITTLFVLLIITLMVAIIYGILLPNLNKLYSGWDVIGALIVLLYAGIVYIAITIVVFIVSIIVSFLAYYKFRVYKNQNEIEVNYGFFLKNNNVFKLDKIKGVIISQGIIERLFKLVSVKLEVIGYQESSSEQNSSTATGLLFPLCKQSEVEENIKRVLPNYIPDKKQYNAKKYFPFISWSILFLGVFMALALAITVGNLVYFNLDAKIISLVVLGFLGVFVANTLLVMVCGILAYKNNGLAIGEDKLTIYNGGFTRKCTIVYFKDVIGIEDITTPLRRKSGIYSFIVHFRSNSETNEIKLKNVDSSFVEKLRNIVKY